MREGDDENENFTGFMEGSSLIVVETLQLSLNNQSTVLFIFFNYIKSEFQVVFIQNKAFGITGWKKS